MSLGRTYSLYITKPNIFLYVIDLNILSAGNGVEYFSCISLAEHFPSPSLYTIEYYISAQHFQFVVLLHNALFMNLNILDVVPPEVTWGIEIVYNLVVRRGEINSLYKGRA